MLHHHHHADHRSSKFNFLIRGVLRQASSHVAGLNFIGTRRSYFALKYSPIKAQAI